MRLTGAVWTGSAGSKMKFDLGRRVPVVTSAYCRSVTMLLQLPTRRNRTKEQRTGAYRECIEGANVVIQPERRVMVEIGLAT